MPSGPVTTLVPVIRTVRALEPKRVLDLGMGTGKFGFLVREQLDWAVGKQTIHLTGVEAFAANVRAHQRTIYDEIVVDDIRDYLAVVNARFDVALLCDVIEHFEPKDSVTVCDRALAIADVLLVTTPSRFFEQHDNVWEEHRSFWPAGKLRQLGGRLGAKVATAELGDAVYASLSRTGDPFLVYDSPARVLARSVRDRLIRPPVNGAPTI